MLDFEYNNQTELIVKHRLAMVAITRGGVEKARDILKVFAEVDLYYPDKFNYGDEEEKNIQIYRGSVAKVLELAFPAYEGIIGIVSLGALIRLAAPLLKDKKTDPAVVVLDELGEFVISALSGHIGGGNDLARNLARAIGATPVITTSSDVLKTLAVDIMGQKYGWKLFQEENLTSMSAAIVNGEPVVVVQESGETSWIEDNFGQNKVPENIRLQHDFKHISEGTYVIAITHRILNEYESKLLRNGILYRPKSIVIGMGCNRDTSLEEIESVISITLQELGFSLESIRQLATIDIKKDEGGLVEVCKKNNWEMLFFKPEELNSVTISDPSSTVFKYTQAWGVSEPAAILATADQQLALIKKKSGNVTISVGIISHEAHRKGLAEKSERVHEIQKPTTEFK